MLDIILPVLVYIQANLDSDLTLARVASHADLSPHFFHRTFRKQVGSTLREYVERLRLERAAFRLLLHEATVLDIALECGYRNHETFTRAFGARFGVSPTAHRERPGSAGWWRRAHWATEYCAWGRERWRSSKRAVGEWKCHPFVTAVEQGRRLGVEIHNEFALMQNEFHLEPGANGGTRLTQKLRVNYRGWVGRLAPVGAFGSAPPIQVSSSFFTFGQIWSSVSAL